MWLYSQYTYFLVETILFFKRSKPNYSYSFNMRWCMIFMNRAMAFEKEDSVIEVLFLL